MKRALLLAVALAFLVGCSSDEETAATETTTAITPAETTTVRVYFLRDSKVWPVLRQVPTDGELATWAFSELTAGPTSQEEAELGLITALPTWDGQRDQLIVKSGVARFTSTVTLADVAHAQLVYTLSQFPAVRKVVIEGERYTRSDFEEQTPSVLVDSPLAFEQVTSPLRAEGTANTFEANFAFTITDAEGDLLAENFVTATSGTGTRGTFEFSESFTADAGDEITLTVFENSAEDGSRMNEVQIPLTVAP